MKKFLTLMPAFFTTHGHYPYQLLATELGFTSQIQLERKLDKLTLLKFGYTLHVNSANDN